jgi:hypothetical protein
MNISARFLQAALFMFALAFISAVTNVSAATFNVTNLNDNGTGSLRQAVLDANSSPGTDAITFQSELIGTIALTTGQLSITQSVAIFGPGARKITVSGNNSSRVFYVNGAPGTVTYISGLTIAAAKISTGYGGCVFNNFGNTLNLSEIAVSNCSAPYGAGIFNDGTLNVARSTIGPFNTATNGGGGIYNEAGTAHISATTISDNTANLGGGINNSAELTLENVTVSNNSAEGARGGGILNGGGVVFLRNTIVAANFARSSGGDLNGSFDSLGNNLIGNNADSNLQASFPSDAAQENGDKIGSSASPLDPKLGALQNNGGQTDTLSLLSGSAAVDAGNNCVSAGDCSSDSLKAGTASTTDQRGFRRQADGNNPPDGTATVDIGAFELFSMPTAASVKVEGRVTVGKRGVYSARVYLTNHLGETRTAITNSLGYYRFEDVRAGETYTFYVLSKQYRFTPQALTINEETTNLNFISEP